MAREYAGKAYDSDAQLEHPEEVRKLVADVGADDEVQAAAILHDLLEDTDAELGDITDKFGPRVARIVEAMTEDESIPEYLDRKEEHRHRARDAGRDVALIFVADKLSNARRMRRAVKEPDQNKLGHYGATLETMRGAYADLPLLTELDAELAAIRDDLERASTS
jgi:(p)ppGpp synthase/HD superfamily hydrolase